MNQIRMVLLGITRFQGALSPREPEKKNEKGRGRGPIARGRLGRQWTRLDGSQRPLYSVGRVIDTWTLSKAGSLRNLG